MMLGIEDILCELADQEEYGFPPGFRFHPTDEELITYYLASKIFHGSHSFFPLDIAEVDLNKCEPWDLPDAAKMGKREWYFYNLRDRKYPTGLRTNRATASGYWKATGKDKEIHSATAASGALIGMKKTLVFYIGRAPRGQKTKWVMHEYRLHGHCSARASAAKEEWVICRISRKTGEKTNMVMNEPGSSSTAGKESFLPQLLDSQLTDQLLKYQASVFPLEYTSLEDDNRTPLMYSDTLQAASTFYPATDIGVNPTTSFSSMLIRSLITNEHQNSKNSDAEELVKTEPNFPYTLPGGADEFEWCHGFLQVSDQCNNHNNINGNTTNLEVELGGGGGGDIQMVVGSNFRIPTGESWTVDA